MERYNKVFKQQEVKHALQLKKKHGLICKQLQLGNDECLPLYLGKSHWTNRFDLNRETTIGIFCAIWVGPTLLKNNQFAYNIHSKALAKLPGYKLKPRTFADEFRSLVNTRVAEWPEIRLDYGPSTLLQGKETFDMDNLADKVENRLLSFVDISHHIDDLLESSLSA